MKKILQEMNNVPFNKSGSKFQIEILNKEKTSEREYRRCLLQLYNRINALKDCEFHRKRLKIDIEELNDKLKNGENKYDKARYKVDIEEKEWNLKNEEKLIADCIIEIDIYKGILSKIPKCNRIQFEKAELEYWKDRLQNDAQLELNQNGRINIDTLKLLKKIDLKSCGFDKNKQLCFIYNDNKQLEAK